MKHTFKRFTVGLALAMGAVWVGAGSPSAGAILAVETDPSEAARPGGPSAAIADCEALFPTRPLPGHPPLPTADFTTLQDAPTQVTGARVVDAAGDVPSHCRVEGYVSPNVEFVLRMPGSSDWNGNFMEASPGGYGGSAERMATWCDEGLRRGYACITHDTGHTGWSSRGSWAYNNLQAEFDYGIRGHHVVALAGKAITEHYYGVAPEFSYHVGCSGGGKQGMAEAAIFPWNFDGILAIEPSNISASGIVALWNSLATHDEDGFPLFTPADLDVLHEGAIAACDADDGLEDGIIGGDPRTCTFDPAELTCERGQRSGCLSPVQVEAARKVYEGAVTSEGEKLSRYRPAYPSLPGSEKGTFFTQTRDYKTSYWQFMGFDPDPGPSWHSTDFDFDHDYKRTGVMDALVNGYNNPDLRNLKAAGGKLMIIQGWEDDGLPGPRHTADYYEMTEKIMGGRASTQESVRLFMIPGRSHCSGGVGAASGDYFSYLEAWVEEGQTPDMMIGYHTGEMTSVEANSSVPDRYDFTRPHYPYPLQARYKGSGDPNDYRNFEPAEPRRR